MEVLSVNKYNKSYIVKSYEADAHGFLRVVSLMNILQDIAVEHADTFGLGLNDCIAKGVVWVGANYFVDIKRLPKIGEKFTIETWPSDTKLWGAIRDFAIYDNDNDVIIRAGSLWVLVDYVKKRPVMLKKFFPEYKIIDERVVSTNFDKIELPDTFESSYIFKVRFDDIDINNHVNNAVYPLWASESIDAEYRNMHQPSEIEIAYEKEALYGENIKVLTSFSGNQSFHKITDEQSGVELARCRIKWKIIT